MQPIITHIDPDKSVVAAAVYNYGKEQYSDGFWRGVSYTTLGFLFLISVKHFIGRRTPN